MSGLSIEEQLAAGASADDLVATGVLYDDYDPDNDPNYFFTPLRPVEVPEMPGMSQEEFEVEMAISDWYNSGRYLREDPSNKPVRSSEKQSLQTGI